MVRADAYAPLRDTLADISRSRAIQGFTPTDTANFVFSLKEPIFDALQPVYHADAGRSRGRDVGGEPACSTSSACTRWRCSCRAARR